MKIGVDRTPLVFETRTNKSHPTIASLNSADIVIDVSKTGYKAMGVASFFVSSNQNTAIAWVNVNIDTQQAVVRVVNNTGAARTIGDVGVTVMYVPE